MTHYYFPRKHLEWKDRSVYFRIILYAELELKPMEQLFEFINNHVALVITFVVLLVAFIVYESSRGGQKLSINEATQMINRDKAVLVDLRSEQEYKAGHVVDAINIPYGTLKTRMNELDKYKERPIILICKMGQHSGAAGMSLTKAGFATVKNIKGGMAEWGAAHLPTVKSKR